MAPAGSSHAGQQYRKTRCYERGIFSGSQRIKELSENQLNLPYVLGQLLFHRVGGVACYVLEQAGCLDEMNREFRNPLKSNWQMNSIKTESFQKALNELAKLFENADFPYAFLKGAYLTQLYPVGLRTSNDFDVLVCQDDLTKVCALLRKGGFIQGKVKHRQVLPSSRREIVMSRMNRGETVPFVKISDHPFMDAVEVDLNFSLDYKAKQESDVVNSLLECRKKIIKTKEGSLYTLSGTDFLIQLCVHLYKEASVYQWVKMGRDLSLYKFCDIYMLLHDLASEDFCNQLKKRIIEFNLQKECCYALFYTRLLFSIENALLDRLIDDIRPDSSEFFRRIYDPEKSCFYQYELGFEDWMFTPNKLKHLKKLEEDQNGNYENEPTENPWDAYYLLRFGRVR